MIFSIQSIRKNTYQIGVIKALGGSSEDIAKIFLLKTLILGAIAAVISFALAILPITLADYTLITSLEETFSVTFKNIHIIRWLPGVLLINSLILFVITTISAFASILILKRIKPIEIIKAKE